MSTACAPLPNPARTIRFAGVPSLTYGIKQLIGVVGSVDPSFGALSGRLMCTVRRHKFNKDLFL